MWKTEDLSILFAAKNASGWFRACCIYFASLHISPMAKDVMTVFECNSSGSRCKSLSPFLRSAVMFCPSWPSLAGSDVDTEILVLSIETQ